jgi:hypothetical protein
MEANRVGFRLIWIDQASRAPMRKLHDRHTELTMRIGPLPAAALGPTGRGGPGPRGGRWQGRLTAQSAVLGKDNGPTMRDFLPGHDTDRRISTKTLVKIPGHVWPRAGFGQGRSVIIG